MAYVDAASINRKTVLYVGGLEESVTEKTLEAAFLPFGDLMQIIMPKDATTKAHRGFGFVEFESAADAAEAMENMDDAQLFGRVLKVKLAKPNAIATQSIWAQREQQQAETDIAQQEQQLRGPALPTA